MTDRPDMNTSSEEEVYRFVRRHLLTQGEKSMGGEGCAYRGHRGRSCAVGCLIPDDKYDASMEGRVVVDLRCLDLACWPPHLDLLLRRLQDIHDSGPTKNWRDRLDSLAREKGWAP